MRGGGGTPWDQQHRLTERRHSATQLFSLTASLSAFVSLLCAETVTMTSRFEFSAQMSQNDKGHKNPQESSVIAGQDADSHLLVQERYLMKYCLKVEKALPKNSGDGIPLT